MNKISKKQFVFGSFWKITETVAAKGVSFVVSLILARLLSPDAYGLIAITNTFTALSDVLIDGGFSTTLIRKKEVDKTDYNCVFIASLGIASVLYCIFFFGAPFVASYYGEDLLQPVLRVAGLVLFIQAFSSTRNAVIQREMRFKLLFYCNLIGSIISGVLGIAAALLGIGVWALVIQQVSQQLIVTALLFYRLHWHFEWHFEWKRFKNILSFSIGVVGASLLNYAGTSIYNLVIGKRYSVKELGYSDKGAQIPMQVSLYTFSALSSVLLPTLSSYQDDKDGFKHILRKVVRMTAYLIFPIMIGMAVVSEELIVVLLTDKWLPAVRIMQYSCLYYIATPFMLINIQVFYALGHGFLRVKTELIRIGLLLSGLFIFSFGFRCDISGLALVSAVIAVIVAVITYIEVKKILPYSIFEILKDIIKPLISSMIMGILVFVVNYEIAGMTEISILIRLMVDLILGVGAYILFSAIFRIDSFGEIVGMLKSRKKNG